MTPKLGERKETMKFFEVEYRLPHDHMVVVGVKAESPEAAVAKAEAAFDQGHIWDNTPDMPLLIDDYGETDAVLVFKAKEVSTFKADSSVQAKVQEGIASSAIDLLRKVQAGTLEDSDHREIKELLEAVDAWDQTGAMQ